MLDRLARPAALDVLRLERVAHRAERTREKTDFVGAHGLRDRTVEITLRDLVRGGGERPDRPEGMTRHANHDTTQHEQRGAEKSDRDPAEGALALEELGLI